MNKVFTLLFLLILLASCDDNKEQKEIFRIINEGNYDNEDSFERYSDTFKTKVIQSFSKNDFVRLSSSKEAKLSIYFYELLVKEYPEEAFHVFLENIDNLNKVMVATSYDTIDEMTVAEAMLYYSTNKNRVFTQEQLEDIRDRILFNLSTKKHLAGYVGVYLYKNMRNPKMKYYSVIRSAIVSNSLDSFDIDIFVSYLSEYHNPEDIVIIADYLRSAIGKGSIDHYYVMQIIKKSPKLMYFDVLKNYYLKVVSNKKIRADECYFELESFVQAIVKYKIVDSKVLLDSVVNEVDYYSDCDFLAPNEHIYSILKNEDSANYFSEIKKGLTLRVDRVKIDSVEAEKNRWK